MSNNPLIEETKANIKRMTFSERQELAEYLVLVEDTPPFSMTDEEANIEAARGAQEIDEAKIRTMSHEEVFGNVRKKLNLSV
jgi:short-subunit dehydrogenase involved in D-alanine esterification of teichoic acids